MARILISETFIPNLGFAFKLGEEALFMSIGVAGKILRQSIRRLTPKRTGFMYRSCDVFGKRVFPHRATVKVGWLRRDFPRGKFYAHFVSEGTGIYGGSHRKIIPKKTKRSTSIRYQYHGRWVSMKSTKGIKPRKLIDRGYAEVKDEIAVLFSKTMFSYLRVYKHA